MKQYRPTAAQLSAIARYYPEPKVRPRLTDEGGFYCYGNGVNAPGETIHKAYIAWISRQWVKVVYAVIHSRRLKLS